MGRIGLASVPAGALAVVGLRDPDLPLEVQPSPGRPVRARLRDQLRFGDDPLNEPVELLDLPEGTQEEHQNSNR